MIILSLFLGVVFITFQPQLIHGQLLECPSDCICHQEYLSNLESWKWVVDTDVNIQKDDPLHHGFNPYTEHNEVYDNPALVKKRQMEQIRKIVTCMLRSNDSDKLSVLMGTLSSSGIEILSLIQAPGSGLLKLQESHFQPLSDNLVGLEIQGYTIEDPQTSNSLHISPTAFTPLKKLTYLNLQRVTLLQKDLGVDPSSKTKYTYNYTNALVDGKQEQVIIIKARRGLEEKVVPYSVYKEEKILAKSTKSQPDSVEPQIAVAFTGLPLLQHLRISGCNLQDGITWDMFYHLDNLQYLLLENNDLLFLGDFVFYATPNLVALSLSRNRLLNLQTVGLAGLLTLQKLDISHNDITYLSELSLPPFPHMEVADFRYNPIESIFPNTFEIMNSTRTLFLGSPTTPLEFSTNSFYGLIALKRLDLINVKLDVLERTMLKGMPELRSLTMTGVVNRILYDAFSEVPKLEKLILKECSIKKISMDAFFGLNSLMELDLSHNQLEFLPPGVFEQQVSLREVFLQYNKLTTLPQSLFSKIPAKLIRLEGNPWHCSCDMKYWDQKTINVVKTYHIPPPNATFCDYQHFKPSLCYKDYQPNFEVKYVYEKRVSPLCQSPETFKGRNVFEVLRRGLHFCPNPLQQNISILLTSMNPTETLELMGTVRVPVPTPNVMEKKIMFPPKVKKPRDAKNANLTSTTTIAIIPTITTPVINSGVDVTPGGGGASSSIPVPKPTEQSQSQPKPSIDPQLQPETDIENNLIPVMWNSNSGNNRTPNKREQGTLTRNNLARYPISKKARKLVMQQLNQKRGGVRNSNLSSKPQKTEGQSF